MDTVAPVMADRAPLRPEVPGGRIPLDGFARADRRQPLAGAPATVFPTGQPVPRPAVQRAPNIPPAGNRPATGASRRPEGNATGEAGLATGPHRLVDAGAVAVAAGLASRADDGSVVFAPRATLGAGVGATRPVAPAGLRSPLVQREADEARAAVAERATPMPPAPPDEASASSDPSPSPSPGATTPSEPTSAAPTPVGVTPAVPVAAGAAPTPMSDRDVDRLARRLYPRLRDHLRGELRLDRERLGRASDLGIRG